MMVASLCEHLHVLPSQLLAEDQRWIQRLALVFGIRAEYEEQKMKQQESKASMRGAGHAAKHA